MTRARFAVGFLAASLFASVTLGADVKDFYKNWADAQKVAAQQGKPVLLYFFNNSSDWCRKFEDTTLSNVAADKALQDYIPVALDGSQPGENQQFMVQLGGRGFPCLIMLTPDKVVLRVVNSYLSADEFVSELAKGKQISTQLKTIQTRLSANPQDYDTNLEAMVLYQEVRMLSNARQCAETVLNLDPQNARGHAGETYVVMLRAAVAKATVLPTSQPARIMSPDQLLAEIRKLDPQSDRGTLEEALGILAVSETSQLPRQVPLGPEATAHCQKALEYLKEMTAGNLKLKHAQQAYTLMFQCHNLLGDKSAAIADMEKAYKADPTTPMAAQIKQALDQLKAKPQAATKP